MQNNTYNLLILAAGRGSRLSSITKTEPKALLKILGLSLIERNIIAAREAGFRKIFIVVGYLGEKIRQKLGDGSKYGVEISYVENSEYLRGNAVSLLKARDKLKNKDFLLIMGDHLYGGEFFVKARDTFNEKEKGKSIIFVDSPENKSSESIKEATKVLVENGEVKNIGKELENFNALDTGAFILNHEIFDLIEKCMDESEELSYAIKILAEKGKIKAEKINTWWVDVDEKSKIKEAEEMLLRSLIKESDGFISKNINRKISLQITKAIAGKNISPSSITLASFILSLIAAALFASGKYFYLALGAILAQFSSIIDGVDGEIARLKFISSEKGAWLDRTLDRYADAFLILGLAYGLWSRTKALEIFFIAYLAILGSFMISYTAKIDEILRNSFGFMPGMRRDSRIFLIFLGAILNQVYALLIFLAIATNAVAILRLYKFKESEKTVAA